MAHSASTHATSKLVGDIGGTNARFARVDATGAIIDVGTYHCADFDGPLAAIQRWLDEHPGPAPRRAAIGVATALDGDLVTLTNHPWRFSIAELKTALTLDELRMLNDFTALALSLPHLKAHERQQIGGGTPHTGSPIALIGPGTGLGVSGLVPANGRFIALEGEGGHVTLAGQTDEELALIAHLQQHYPHVSAERVLSGPGLVVLHDALAVVRKQTMPRRTPAEISQLALEDRDTHCHDVLATFCALLGTTAANLALSLGARGGVYIGGGIVPRFGDYFAHSPFRARFEDKGRFSDYLAAIPTWVITADTPALTGAAAALSDA